MIFSLSFWHGVALIAFLMYPDTRPVWVDVVTQDAVQGLSTVSIIVEPHATAGTATGRAAGEPVAGSQPVAGVISLVDDSGDARRAIADFEQSAWLAHIFTFAPRSAADGSPFAVDLRAVLGQLPSSTLQREPSAAAGESDGGNRAIADLAIGDPATGTVDATTASAVADATDGTDTTDAPTTTGDRVLWAVVERPNRIVVSAGVERPVADPADFAGTTATLSAVRPEIVFVAGLTVGPHRRSLVFR